MRGSESNDGVKACDNAGLVREKERLESMVEFLEQRQAENLKHINRLARQIWTIRSLVDMPELYLDEDWSIVGYSGNFPFISSKVVELTKKKAPLESFIYSDDIARIKEHLLREQALAELPYNQGHPWQLKYKGPNSGDEIGRTWIVYNADDDRNWEIARDTGTGKIRHIPGRIRERDTALMSCLEYGGADEDLKVEFTFRTSNKLENILDISVIISGGSGLEESGPYYVGYLVGNGAFYNSESRIERQGAVVTSRPESLEPDTEYRVTVERIGGRILRRMRNLRTGQESLPLEYFDSRPIYERQNYVGFYTYSGELELYDIEIFTRKSLFSIDQFNIPFNLEIELNDEQLKGRIFNLKIARNIRISKTLYIIMLEDITERKRAEIALSESERKYRSLFEDIRVPLCLISSERNFLDVNQAMLDTFGYSREEMLTSNLDLFFVDFDDLEEFQRELSEKGYVRNFETKLKKRNETCMDCLITLSIRQDSKDGRLLFMGSLLDITERNWMEARLQESQRMEVVGKLASGVAHEVRNPLNTILAITENLFDNNEMKPENQTYIELFRNQVNRLSTLMRDLLDLGKPPQSDRFTPCTIVDDCTMAVDIWKQATNEEERDVVCRFPLNRESPVVLGDSAKLQQVIINLLENAAQHSKIGSRIELVIPDPAFGEVIIRVIDHGSGIPPENLSEVFKPFFTTRKRGSGLGLSIVKSIVESHAGTIAIRNNDQERGCMVEIRLPLAKGLTDESKNSSCR